MVESPRLKAMAKTVSCFIGGPAPGLLVRIRLLPHPGGLLTRCQREPVQYVRNTLLSSYRELLARRRTAFFFALAGLDLDFFLALRAGASGSGRFPCAGASAVSR